MEGSRSRSYADGGMRVEVYRGRTCGTSHSYGASSFVPGDRTPCRAGKKSGGAAAAAASSSKGGWAGFLDPEMQRKKRVAGYKLYAVEGKMKISFRNGFRWIKDKYTQMIYGFS